MTFYLIVKNHTYNSSKQLAGIVFSKSLCPLICYCTYNWLLSPEKTPIVNFHLKSSIRRILLQTSEITLAFFPTLFSLAQAIIRNAATSMLCTYKLTLD